MKKVQLLKNGGMRYSNVRIENNPTGNFSDMVVITKTPSKLKSLLDKKFINIDKAVTAIDVAGFNNMLKYRRVDIEMMNYGIVPLAETAACGKVI
jgi:hypothetical protein